jgi:dihydrofolate reductase
MSKVVLYIAASLDGFIARADDDIAWLTRYDSPHEDHGYADLMRRVDTLIMGARTYEQVLGFGDWFYQGKKTYVVTHRELPQVPGAEVAFYSGDLTALVADLKAATDKDIWLLGGGQLAGSFMNEGLVDEIMLFVIPITLGSGKPLFVGMTKATELTLVETKPYESGIVLLRYSMGEQG